MKRIWAAAAAAMALVAGTACAQPHNLVIFVADGLRSRIVTQETAPTLAAVRAQGVDFRNSHSMIPTVTTPNASAMATGHRLGDTGDFGNNLYVGEAFPPPFGVAVAPLEDDAMLGAMNGRFGGDYLGHDSLLETARAKGYATAVLGKLGPAAVWDVRCRQAQDCIVIDDGTNGPPDDGVKLAPDITAAIKAAGLPAMTPDRGLNLYPGAYNMPGVRVANVEQQDWFAAVAAKVLIPRFKAQGKPFVLVFWSRDPDGTQHGQGDSLRSMTPGINGPTTMAAIRNADNDLATILKALKDQGLDADTNVVTLADHGFSTVARESATSGAAKLKFPDVFPGDLPPGFLAIDLAQALGLPLLDAVGFPIELKAGFHPKSGALIGKDPKHPSVAVAANGGSDLIYLPGPDAKALAPKVVEALTKQDYVAAIFLRDDLGPVPGALPTSLIGLDGDARTPKPALLVTFRSFSIGCSDPEICGVEVADTELQPGQGIHGAASRQDTHNFMAAMGPDFRKGFVDPAPISNADMGATLRRLIGAEPSPGPNPGRLVSEALEGSGAAPAVEPMRVESEPAANGFKTIAVGAKAGGQTYVDAAGAPGRAIGLPAN
jgi:hypothetical protein